MRRPFFISCETGGSEAVNVPKIIRDICIKIEEKPFEISPFAEGIDDIGIIVNCFSDYLLAQGWGKPRKNISYKKGSADIRLPIPYNDFMAASYEDQYYMVVKNIVDSINVIEEKCAKSKRAKLDADGLIKQFLSRLEISEDDIKDVKGVMSDEEYSNFVTRDF